MKSVDFVYYFPYIFAGAVILVIAAGFYVDKKRKEKIREYAEKNGFEYDQDGMLLINYIGFSGDFNSKTGFLSFFRSNDDVSDVLHSTYLNLFDTGHSRKTKNIISIPFKKSKIFLFDYYYTVGSGKNSTTYSQTVAIYKSDNKFPSFSMRPEGFFDSITSLIGYNDIDFPEYPSFSKSYYLKSKNEVLIREFFTDNRIRIFEQYPGWYVEGNENFIVFYKKKLVSLKNYLSYIDEINKLLTSLDI